MFSHLFRRSKVALALLLTWNFSFTYAEDRPDEHLILTDCGIQPNRDSLYRHILYYKGSPWDDHNIPLRAPDMHVDIPWDGSYPWRLSGVTTNFPNGDKLSVYIDPAVPDITEPPNLWAGHAIHTFGLHEFTCYKQPRPDEITFVLGDDAGSTCHQVYVCFHDIPVPKPDPTPAPSPPVTYGRSTNITISSAGEKANQYSSVRGFYPAMLTPQAAFATLGKAIEGNTCKTGDDGAFDITDGGDCKIKWSECLFLGLDAEKKAIVDLFGNDVGTEVAKTEKSKTHFGRVTQWEKWYEYPKSGKLITGAGPVGHEDSWAVRNSVAFTIECHGGNSICNMICSAIVDVVVAKGEESDPTGGIFGKMLSNGCDSVCG